MTIKNLISICIPCYEMSGKGSVFLSDLLDSILDQTYQHYEVIVSDHSIDDNVKNTCSLYENKMDIGYFRNTNNLGSSSENINNAIKLSNGDIIKPMFQDDFFISSEALETIINSPYHWGACACMHTGENRDEYHTLHYANWHDDMRFGMNMIGCPSVIFFKKDIDTFFDNSLKWLMDCELYHRLFNKYGMPHISATPHVCVRLWDNTITNTLSQKEKDEEVKILKERYV